MTTQVLTTSVESSLSSLWIGDLTRSTTLRSVSVSRTTATGSPAAARNPSTRAAVRAARGCGAAFISQLLTNSGSLPHRRNVSSRENEQQKCCKNLSDERTLLPCCGWRTGRRPARCRRRCGRSWRGCRSTGRSADRRGRAEVKACKQNEYQVSQSGAASTRA